MKLSKILKETIRYISPVYYHFQSKPNKLASDLFVANRNPTEFTQASPNDIQREALEKEATTGQMRQLKLYSCSSLTPDGHEHSKEHSSSVVKKVCHLEMTESIQLVSQEQHSAIFSRGMKVVMVIQ